MGRGDGDRWSDIDLIVVCRDQATVSQVASLGARDAILVHRADGNAPAGGQMFSALHVLDGLPCFVDWNIWTPAWAPQPSDVRVLVGPDEPQDLDSEAVLQRRPRQPHNSSPRGGFEAMMISIAAKHLARDESDIADLLRAAGCELAPTGDAALAAVDERLRQLERHNEIDAATFSAISKQLDVIRRKRVGTAQSESD